MITISDYSPNVNITEAGFDRFSITNYDITSTPSLPHKTVNFYPNPTYENITVEGLELGKKILLIDLNGNILQEITTDSEIMTLDVSFLNAGIYLLNHNGKNHKLIKN
jgi:hypothetical protein